MKQLEDVQRLLNAWNTLPVGARMALEQQWAGLAAGGLPCGSTILDSDGHILAAGRNHAYDLAGEIETRARYPLQHTRLAHAEFNALALIPTEIDHTTLTLWTTQHPCAMCAAAMRFVGIGKVCFVADDPSDDSAPATIVGTHGDIPYAALGDPLWWTISNLLFLYNSAVQRGERAGNLQMNRDRYPDLVGLTLAIAQNDTLGQSARAGATLPQALAPHLKAILHATACAPQ